MEIEIAAAVVNVSRQSTDPATTCAGPHQRANRYDDQPGYHQHFSHLVHFGPIVAAVVRRRSFPKGKGVETMKLHLMNETFNIQRRTSKFGTSELNVECFRSLAGGLLTIRHRRSEEHTSE